MRTILFSFFIFSQLIFANTPPGPGLPSQSGHSGQFLTTNGTSPSWTAAGGGSGTVTSVSASVPSFLTIAGSPVTTSGTLAISYSGTALPLANGGTGQTSAANALTALGGLKTDFSNMSSSSAANHNLFFDTGTFAVIGTKDANDTTQALVVQGGNSTIGVGAEIILQGGQGATGGGNATLQAADATAALGDGGTAWVIGGTPGAGGNPGNVKLATSTGGQISFSKGDIVTIGLPWVSTSSGGNGNYQILGVAGGGTGIASGTSGGVPYFSSSTAIGSSGALTADQVILGGGAGVAPHTLTAGSQYQVLRMGASTPAYGSIDLSQSAAVTGTLANANTTATNANTASAIVARDGSGNFIAGTITAALTGAASGNLSATANNHGLLISGSANVATVLAPASVSTKYLRSNGSSADPTWEDLSSSWIVKAKISGATPSIPVNGSLGDITDAGLTMTPDAMSAAAGITCSSTNAAATPTTSTSTCAAGSEDIGINFALPGPGIYEACFQGGTYFALSAANVYVQFSYGVVETPTAAQTISTDGNYSAFILGAPTGSRFGTGISLFNCSQFDWRGSTAGTVKAVRLFEKEGNTDGSPSQQLLCNAGIASEVCTWTIKRI